MNQTLAYKAALEWYLDVGVDEVLADTPSDKTAMPELPRHDTKKQNGKASDHIPKTGSAPLTSKEEIALGASEALTQATKLAQSCTSVEELKKAIADFDGLAIKKTASNLVFADGNPNADIMLIGEVPSADEDRQGKPFIGDNGLLLDKILGSIDLARNHDDKSRAVYLTNLINWRPPGNRSPSQSEIDVTLPFIERHIALVNPKILILCGSAPAKALLGKSQPITRIRGKWMEYTPRTAGITDGTKFTAPIKTIATFHPAQLLTTPSQKKSVWMDMLTIKKERAQ